MVIKAHRLTGIWEKAKGLIGTPAAYPVYFETRWGIHTFGMKYPLDVLILDSGNRVIKMTEKLKPNKIWLWNPNYKKILELPSGYINRRNIKIGTFVYFSYVGHKFWHSESDPRCHADNRGSQ